jgi:hypothetical protein
MNPTDKSPLSEESGQNLGTAAASSTTGEFLPKPGSRQRAQRRRPAVESTAIAEGAASSVEAPVSEPLPGPASNRRRTAPPQRVEEGDVVPATNGEGSVKMQQALHLHDFLHNPHKIDLRDNSLDTSSTREEIQGRMIELRYRLSMLGGLSRVLTEELETLEATLKTIAE